MILKLLNNETVDLPLDKISIILRKLTRHLRSKLSLSAVQSLSFDRQQSAFYSL